ncbi:TPA: ABC transporter permease [Legionella anisa]|uniref:ABC transporter permease n=1 Tax=Legionella anisa TaxID=28082 RepID=UPI00135F168D|nr:ABC transporter permease [Legionella anisa]MBN5937200.1 ABC transporter permease [Legionella anisa]MCW8423740.1 ABC transporter permease [Legionella anisa]UAK81123.1 ABC transporter permease [Legionella anisa]
MKANNIYKELKAIFVEWPIWFMLGTQDIKLRYRFSSIGPFWITINMAITVYSMSFLYSHLFKVKLEDYLPYLTSGIICWSFLSNLFIEGSNAFIEASNYIKNQEIFVSHFLMRLFLRNIIIFAHNLLVYLPIIFLFNIGISFKIVMIIPGLLLIGLNAVFWGTLLAVITTKYRDFGQIVNNLIQIAFFLTPIMWLPNLLPSEFQWLIHYNPLNQFLNLIRAPLMNTWIDLPNLYMVVLISFLGFILYGIVLRRYKNYIVFWL